MPSAKPKKTAASAKKIVDVKHEGDAATGTSRPVIVSNRPIMKDPMMAEVSQLTEDAASRPITVKAPEPEPEVDEPKPAAVDEPVAPPSKKKLVIKPLSDTDDTETEPAASASPSADESSSKPVDAEAPSSQPEPSDTDNQASAHPVDTEVKPAKEVPISPVTKPEATTAAQPGRSFGDDDKTKLEPTLDVDEKQTSTDKNAKDTLVDGLNPEQQKAVEAGTYFLPITTAETRRLRRDIVLVVVVLLILVAVWANIMLDAEMIELGNLKAVTDFF